MSGRKLLAAWTPARDMPPYLNITMADDKVEITVRGEKIVSTPETGGTSFPIYGATASIVMTCDEFRRLCFDVINSVRIVDVPPEPEPVQRLEVFTRPECIFAYCDNPGGCLDACQHQFHPVKSRHACPEWDGMIIDESMPEFAACLCKGRKP